MLQIFLMSFYPSTSLFKIPFEKYAGLSLNMAVGSGDFEFLGCCGCHFSSFSSSQENFLIPPFKALICAFDNLRALALRALCAWGPKLGLYVMLFFLGFSGFDTVLPSSVYDV